MIVVLLEVFMVFFPKCNVYIDNSYLYLKVKNPSLYLVFVMFHVCWKQQNNLIVLSNSAVQIYFEESKEIMLVHLQKRGIV